MRKAIFSLIISIAVFLIGIFAILIGIKLKDPMMLGEGVFLFALYVWIEVFLLRGRLKELESEKENQ